MARFVHSSDWQLGMKRRFLGEDAQARFEEARFDAIRTIGRIAAEESAEFVLVCGDVFESNAVDRRTLARALEALEAVPVPVYLLPGNHDPLDAGSIYHGRAFRSAAPDHVHVLDDARPRTLRPGLELVGMPWTSKRPDRDLVASACAELDPAAPGTTRIAAAHGAVDALSPDRNDPARIGLEAAERALTEGRMHFLALGDRHSLTPVGSGRIHYAGTPEPTDWSEVQPGFVLLVDVDPERVEVRPRPVARWRFERRRRIPLDSAADLDALEGWLAALPDKTRRVLRLDFEGSLDLRGMARLESILEHARDLFACVDVWEPDNDLVVRPEDADFDALGLSGFAARAVERLRAEAGESGEARDALALLVRLAGGAEGAP